MGKRRIIWSENAKRKLFEIMNFYAKRNKSKTYSIKLYKKINRELSILVTFPEIGINTEIDSVRGLIIKNYIIFYEITNENIVVHTLWDSRQNPEKLKII